MDLDKDKDKKWINPAGLLLTVLGFVLALYAHVVLNKTEVVISKSRLCMDIEGLSDSVIRDILAPANLSLTRLRGMLVPSYVVQGIPALFSLFQLLALAVSFFR